MVSEVDEEPQTVASRFQVVVDLRTVFVIQVRNGLDLDDDLLKADEVRLVRLLQPPLLVSEGQLSLRQKWNSPQSEFNLKAFLVDGLQKSAAHFVVHLEASPEDHIRFLFEDQLHSLSPFSLFSLSSFV